MLYESLKSPREAAARQHMRQHGKFEKIRSQNPSNDEVFGQFLNIFPEAPKWMFCHPFDVFWCPEGPGMKLVWSLMKLGNLFFSSKFSFFDPKFCQDCTGYKFDQWLEAYAQAWDLKLIINFQNIDLVCCHSQRIAIFLTNIDKNNINVQKIQQKMKAKMKSFVKFNIKIEITTWNDSEPRVQIENLR